MKNIFPTTKLIVKQKKTLPIFYLCSFSSFKSNFCGEYEKESEKKEFNMCKKCTEWAFKMMMMMVELKEVSEMINCGI